jgi:predicted transcriptional regulator
MPTLQKPKRGVKSLAMKLVRTMPENATWDDLMYRVYVSQKIEAGLSDLKAGRKHSHDDIKRQFGLLA